MKRIISILICFSLVFTLSACSTQTGGDTASAPVISISKRLLAQDCYSDDGETLLLRYSDQVPGVAVSSADEAADKINEAINAISQNFAANDVEGSDLGIDNLLAVAKEHYASSPDSFTSYALERSFDVTRGDSSLLSIVFESYINSGGVHPNVVYTTANFSTVTGEKLSFSDLSENPDGLKTLCLNYIKGLITGGNYPPNTFNDGYESALSDLFADDLWYFSHEGLTFVANAYALASYAAGSFRFTVPYSEIHNQLKSEYLIPERAQSSGEISAAASQADGTLTGMVFDDAGEKILLSVKGNVYDVKLCSVNYNDYDGSFVSSGAALFYSDLISGQTISITASIPDTIPNLQLSWRTADGEEQKRLISQSGEDGSILLLDYEESLNLNPLEITQLLPYSVDLDGNGTEETISLETETDENDEAVYRVVLTDSNGSASFKTDLSGLKAVWLADANSDGTQEIFISGNYITDDYSTYCLCYTADGALEPLQFTGDDRGDASEVNTVFNGYIEDISDSEGIILAGVCNVLGTYKGTRHYEFIDSCLRPAPGSVWSLADNEVWLTLKSDLPVTYDNGGSGYLTAGGSVLFTSTDISSWIRFTDSTGTTGLIALDKQNDGGGYKISGIGESSYFDSIPYAG